MASGGWFGVQSMGLWVRVQVHIGAYIRIDMCTLTYTNVAVESWNNLNIRMMPRSGWTGGLPLDGYTTHIGCCYTKWYVGHGTTGLARLIIDPLWNTISSGPGLVYSSSFYWIALDVTEKKHTYMSSPGPYLINSSPPGAAYMRQWIESALAQIVAQIMACRLIGAKPLSKPMLVYCQLDP